MKIYPVCCLLTILLQTVVVPLPAAAMSASDANKINSINLCVLGKSGTTTDLDLNGDSIVNVADVIFAIQHQVAVKSFAISSGASTASSRAVTLNNTCSTTPTLYKASESSSFPGAAWNAWSAAPSFTLSDGNVTKTVYFKVKNAYGLESDIVTDSIALVQVASLTVGAAASSSAISPAGDADWFKFTVSSTSTYQIESWAGTLADNVMSLYGPGSMDTLIATDDNSGDGNAALIALTLKSGAYYVKVQAASSSSTGDYSIRVTNEGSLKVTSFSINGGDDATTTRTVKLKNAVQGAPTHYMASESSDFSGASWQTYSTAPSFQLTAGSGGKKVYFKVKDLGGAQSSSVNDSITYREVVALPTDGTIVSAKISKSAEEDWYALTITSAGVYTVQTYEGSLVDTSIGLADAPDPDDDEWMATNEDIDEDDNLMSRVTGWLDAGTYYVRVESGDGSTGSYTIRAWSTDNTKLTVNGSSVSGYISSSTDENWFRFVVSSSGTYSIKTTADYLEYGNMELYSDSFKKIAVAGADIGPDPSDMPVMTAALSAGTYVIRFTGATSDDTGDFTIDVVSGSASGATNVIMIGGPYAGGSITSTSELDWYEFAITNEDSYTIEMTAGTMSAAYLKLCNSNLAILRSSYSSASGAMPSINDVTLTAGVYYVGISSYYSGIGTYKIKAKN